MFTEACQELFPQDPIPETLSQPCCAQFAVFRQQIRRHPKERYMAWHLGIMNTELDNAMSGRVFGYIWQYLFTSAPVHCPNMHICYCDAYFIGFRDEHEYIVYGDVQDTYRAFCNELAMTQNEERRAWLQSNGDDLSGKMARRRKDAEDLGTDRRQKYEILSKAWDELVYHPPGHLAEKYGHFGFDSSISPSPWM